MAFGNGQTYTEAATSDAVTEHSSWWTAQCGSIVGQVDVVRNLLAGSVGKCSTSMQTILERTFMLVRISQYLGW